MLKKWNLESWSSAQVNTLASGHQLKFASCTTGTTLPAFEPSHREAAAHTKGGAQPSLPETLPVSEGSLLIYMQMDHNLYRFCYPFNSLQESIFHTSGALHFFLIGDWEKMGRKAELQKPVMPHVWEGVVMVRRDTCVCSLHPHSKQVQSEGKGFIIFIDRICYEFLPLKRRDGWWCDDEKFPLRDPNQRIKILAVGAEVGDFF